jgi:hypothetical protein
MWGVASWPDAYFVEVSSGRLGLQLQLEIFLFTLFQEKISTSPTLVILSFERV